MTTKSHVTDGPDLVQRFVDQELTAEERVRFIARLGHDEGLRRRALALEQVSLAASQAPRPALPADFVANVLSRIEPKRPAWRRLADLAWQPRPLQWNLAGALAASLLLVLLGGAMGWSIGGRRAPARSAVNSAGTRAPVLVRLVVLQPDARSVQVAGDFNGWNPAQTPLEQLANGAWTVTLPLEPGRYEYMFVVDGTMWVDDPFAPEQADDGFGARNAVLDVRPPAGGTL